MPSSSSGAFRPTAARLTSCSRKTRAAGDWTGCPPSIGTFSESAVSSSSGGLRFPRQSRSARRSCSPASCPPTPRPHSSTACSPGCLHSSRRCWLGGQARPRSNLDKCRQPRLQCRGRPGSGVEPCRQPRLEGTMDQAADRSDAQDDTGCHILHIDMDAFYASVEIRDRQELAARPVIVGHTGGRGVVLSANYLARGFGVRSAMPVSRAQRLCPNAVFVAPRHGVYSAVSREVMAIFQAVTPEVEPLSLDEAFLDVAGAVRRLGSPAVIGRMIRCQVRDELGITCSVGIASSKFVAKLASVHCKPDGLLVIPADRVLEFLHPLPVSALWGVGERTGQVLAKLADAPAATLERELGKAVAAHLIALAWGRDDRAVVPDVREKSVGAEETFDTDVDDPDLIRRELLRLAGRTARG